MEFNTIYNGLISGKEKLALVGLGYVGMPIAVEFAKHIMVIGFDINEKRVQEYASGIDATNESYYHLPKEIRVQNKKYE